MNRLILLPLILPLLLASLALPLLAQATEPDADGLRRLVRGTHDRLVFDQDIERIAVGDPEMMSIESITTREVLLRGREIGRTSIVLWFADGTIEASQWVIQPDLRVLEQALREVDPSITARIAPDRDAIVLRGEVTELALALQAESITQDYLQVGLRQEERDPRTEEARATEGEAFPDENASPESETIGSTAKRKSGSVRNRSAVINLIRYPTPTPTPIEDRIEAAISSVAGVGVVVRRVPVGPSPDNSKDVFLLEGAVPDQIALTRVLQLAGSVIDPGGGLDITVVADEAGGLAGAGSSAQSGGGGGGGGGAASGGGVFGGNPQQATNSLSNRIEANIGRATVLSTAGGRVLSFLEVRDLPQVRVQVQLYELNRTKLRSRGIDITGLGANFDQPALVPGQIASSVQGANGAARIEEDDLQAAAGWLDGAFTSQFQLNIGRFAMDSVLRYLESEGIARNLSRPSMTVLSGETAMFQVGGEVPIPSALGSANSDFLIATVQFRSFGIQLAVRPLVGRHGFLTLDVSPQIVSPDATLTSSLRETTGSTQDTTAFSTRILQTTTRLRDGQVMLLGGLMNRTDNEDNSSLPGFSDLPLFGWLFEKQARSSDEIELVIVVSPAVLREDRYETHLWESPVLLDAIYARFLGR